MFQIYQMYLGRKMKIFYIHTQTQGKLKNKRKKEKKNKHKVRKKLIDNLTKFLATYIKWRNFLKISLPIMTQETEKSK